MGKKLFLVISIFVICIALLGCGSSQAVNPSNTSKNEGVVTLSYDKPIDFKTFEVYVSTTPGFNPTGWNGSKWSGTPNSPTEWNGSDKTLHTISANSPIQVLNLVPGTRYYFRVVVVDQSNQRSDPSAEISQVAGNAQQSSTFVVAASDASPASRAGADFVCTGTDDQNIINQAISALPVGGGTITLTEGTFFCSDVITIPSNIVLIGSGNSTIIDNSSFDRNTKYLFWNEDQTNGNSNSSLSNFSITTSNQSTYSNGICFRNVSGFTVKGITSTAIFSSNALIVCGNNNIVSDCSFSNGSINYAPALYFQGSGNKIINNYIFGNGIGVQFYGNTGDSSNIISGNHIYNNYYAGMMLQTINDSSITGNEVYNNNNQGDSTPTHGSNIWISSANNNNIQNNTCRTGGATNKPLYGIYIASGTANLVTNNDCYTGGTTAGIYNAGTNTNFGSGNRNNSGSWSTTPS